ncbi:MAG: WD40 domain-containing protein [Bacteroidales bacterium]|nr:WD40 domain-containing protein [Bacteroidales bacterium]
MNNTISSNPWPGLGSYDDSGRYMFCGRRKATNELYSLISDHTVVSLYGRSGIGKTSLLKAGVMPLLSRRGYLPVYVRLSQEEKTPDENGRTLTYSECVVRCIESKIRENGFTQNNTLKKAIEPDDPSFIWSYFCKVSFQSPEGNRCTPVVILDQYEEIFQDQREKAALLMRQLYALVDDSRRLPDDLDYDDFRNRFRFVMSFRDDSLFRLEDVINEYNLTAFKENRYLLKALSRDEAMNVITEPAEGLVAEDVSKQILDKVVSMSDGSSVDPAILSLLMYGLYDRMIQTGSTAIRSVLVGEAGDDIVRSFYEQGMAGIGITARKFLEEHLVSSDERRRSVAVADLKAHVNDEDLKMLTNRHILTRLERGRFTDYELTHDVLCPIVAASRADTLTKEKIAKNRRMARIMAAIVVVVLAIVAVFLFQNRRLKEQRWTALGNQSRFVAEKALQLAEDGDAYLAKLLLMNTMPSDLDKPERPLTTESVLALGKIFDNENGILRGHTSYVCSASYSPDGKHIVSASRDGTIKIWKAIPPLQEMLDITRERFKDRELTPEERHRYYLE